jgi:hypothetical protein
MTRKTQPQAPPPYPPFSIIFPPLLRHHTTEIDVTLRRNRKNTNNGLTSGNEIHERLPMHVMHMARLAAPLLSSDVFLRIRYAIC